MAARPPNLPPNFWGSTVQRHNQAKLSADSDFHCAAATVPDMSIYTSIPTNTASNSMKTEWIRMNGLEGMSPPEVKNSTVSSGRSAVQHRRQLGAGKRCVAKSRKWLNCDDGKLCRVGNRSLGALEAIGLLVATCAIGLWQLHVKIGISSIWTFAAGGIGLVLASASECWRRR